MEWLGVFIVVAAVLMMIVGTVISIIGLARFKDKDTVMRERQRKR